MSLIDSCIPHNLILSFQHQWKLKELALFLQIKELLMDKEAAQYFVKLHIIAGQMNTQRMNNTDTFYTLTGKSGEIFSGDNVRLSLIFTSRTKVSPEPVLTVKPICGWAPEGYKELPSLFLVCQSTSLWGKKQRETLGRIGQMGSVLERGLEIFCSGLNSSPKEGHSGASKKKICSKPLSWQHQHTARSASPLQKEMDCLF